MFTLKQIDTNSSELLSELSIQSFFQAYESSSPAGLHVISHDECPVKLGDPSTELKQIYVLSGYYGGGLGRTLFDSAGNHARNKQSKWLWLWLWLCVLDINFRAQAFYRKLGFSIIGQGSEPIVGNDALSSSIMVLDFGTKNA